MNPDLLQSQFDELEQPEDAIVVDISQQSPEEECPTHRNDLCNSKSLARLRSLS